MAITIANIPPRNQAENQPPQFSIHDLSPEQLYADIITEASWQNLKDVPEIVEARLAKMFPSSPAKSVDLFPTTEVRLKGYDYGGEIVSLAKALDWRDYVQAQLPDGLAALEVTENPKQNFGSYVKWNGETRRVYCLGPVALDIEIATIARAYAVNPKEPTDRFLMAAVLDQLKSALG